MKRVMGMAWDAVDVRGEAADATASRNVQTDRPAHALPRVAADRTNSPRTGRADR